MPTFNYTLDPSVRLTASYPNANINDVLQCFLDLSSLLQTGLSANNFTPALNGQLGLTDASGQVGRGKTNIAAAESTGSGTPVALGTPDKVTGVDLPTDGLIVVAYQAIWQNSVASTGRAGIFLGATQVKIGQAGGVPLAQNASGPSTTSQDETLGSTPLGLVGNNGGGGGSSEVSTGQIVANNGGAGQGGPAYIFASAGTYDVSVLFWCAGGGTVTAKARHLWVWTVGF